MSKASQRKTARELLLSLPGEQKLLCTQRICENLRKTVELLPGMVILSYLAAETEADPSLFDREAAAAGARVAYPVCGAEGRMEFFYPGERYLSNRFGIREPEPAPERRVDPALADVILVPCLAFDREGGRLGHGGGYYDRYLTRCPGAVKVLVAFSCQETERVCREEHDAVMDFLVTDTDICRAGCYNSPR